MLTINTNTLIAGELNAKPGSTLADHIRQLILQLKKAYAVNAERRALSKLSPDQLKDIGISQAQASQECNRAAFDLPKR